MGITPEEMLQGTKKKKLQVPERMSAEQMRAAAPKPDDYNRSMTTAAGTIGGHMKSLAKSVEGAHLEAAQKETARAKATGTPYSLYNQYADVADRLIMGGLKALAGGLHTMGELTVSGVAAGAAAIPRMMPGGESPSDAFVRVFEQQRELDAKSRELFEKVTHVNLAPADEADAAMEGVIMALPQGIKSVGETVYEKTGWAIAGAGAEAAGAYLLLRPEIAAKSFGSIKNKITGKPQTGAGKANAKRMEEAFDEMAVKTPGTAVVVARHVREADPVLGDHLLTRIEEAGKANPEAAGYKKAQGTIYLGHEKPALPPPEGGGGPGGAGPGGGGGTPPKATKPPKTKLTKKALKEAQPLATEYPGLPKDAAISKALEEGRRVFADSEMGGPIEVKSPADQYMGDMYVTARPPAPTRNLGTTTDFVRQVERKGPGPFDLEGFAKRKAEKEKGYDDVTMAQYKKRLQQAVDEGKITKKQMDTLIAAKDVADVLPDPKAKAEGLQTRVEQLPNGEWGVWLDNGINTVRGRPTFVTKAAAEKWASQARDTDAKLREMEEARGGETVMVGEESFEITQKGKEFVVNYLGQHGVDPPELLGTFPTKSMAKAHIDELTKHIQLRQQMKVIPGGKAEKPLVPELPAEAGAASKYPTYRPEMAMRAEEGLAKAMTELYQATIEVPRDQLAPLGMGDPVLFMHNGREIPMSEVKGAFTFRPYHERGQLDLSALEPGVRYAMGKIAGFIDGFRKEFSTEGRGPKSEAAGAIIASAMARRMMNESMKRGPQHELRQKFWNMRPDLAKKFLLEYEKGVPFEDPMLQKAAEAYRTWSENLYKAEQRFGKNFEYDPVDNYIYHLFERTPELEAYLASRGRGSWGDPRFVKERVFKSYEEAAKAGFRPKFSNPEDIMMARQHASDLAIQRAEMLEMLAKEGLALPTSSVKSAPHGFSPRPRRSPSGESYWIADPADAILANLFDTKSLWNLGKETGAGGIEKVVGAGFRGAMALKNTTVPILLSVSAFHPLHVLTLDNIPGAVAAAKEMAGRSKTPVGAAVSAALSLGFKGIISHPKQGGRINSIIRGEVPEAQWTTADRAALQAMVEGGFFPMRSHVYKTNAIANFRSAIQQTLGEATHGTAGKAIAGGVRSVWHLPWAATMALQVPVFEWWIPALKTSAYLRQAAAAVKADPSLLENPTARMIAYRKIAKEVDNFYGEMAYDTLFWRNWAKDIVVGATLSWGWNYGFLRMYGGAPIAVGKSIAKGRGPIEGIKKGDYDKVLTGTLYLASAMALGGLMHYWLSGKRPEQLEDYIYPKSGEKNPDGTDQRLNTMFWTREFASVYKHAQAEGWAAGLGHVAANKVSPSLPMIRSWITGLDSLDNEIRDPNSPAFRQVLQSLAHSFGEIEPISISTLQQLRGEPTGKTIGLSIGGFSPAPRYAISTDTENRIRARFLKYHKKAQTPFERAEYSEDRREAQRFFDEGMMREYDEKLTEMERKYDLSPGEIRRMEKAIIKAEDPLKKMFARLDWHEQKRLLDQMTPDERDVYVPVSNKDHLRHNYVPPEERQ